MFKRTLATLIFFAVIASTAFAVKTAFIDGTPSTGVKGTKVTAAFLNAVNTHFCTGLDTDGDCALAYSAATGTNDLITTFTPTTAFPAAYVTGMPLYIKTAATNTGAMTLNANSIGQVAIKKNGTAALVAGDVVAGQMIVLSFDGTNMQLQSPAAIASAIWDGTVGRSASPTAAANTVPVSGGDNFLASGWGVRIDRLNNAGNDIITDKTFTTATYYTVGPTGSGANIIWTQLDAVPSGARYVILDTYINATHSTDAFAMCMTNVRFHYNDANNYAYGTLLNYANAASEVSYDSATVFVPLDSNRIFKIYWAFLATANSSNMWVARAVGYIH